MSVIINPGGSGSAITIASLDGLTSVSSVSSINFSNSIQPSPATQGTPAYVQSASTNISATTSVTLAYSSNVTAGNLLVVCATWNSGSALLTPTDSNGNQYFAVQPPKVNGAQSAQIWYAINHQTGSNTVTFTFSASVSGPVFVHEYSGCDRVAPNDGQNTGFGSTPTNSTFSSNSITSNWATELVFGFAWLGGTNISAGSGFNGRQNNGTGSSFGQTEDEVVTSIGTYSTSFNTTTGGNYITLIATFKAATATTTTGAARIYIPVTFPIDVPPSQPSPWDDEFDSQTLNSKWTVVAASAGIQWDIDTSLRSCISVRVPAAASVPVANGAVVLRQPVTTFTTDQIFSVTMKIFSGIPLANFQEVGTWFSDTSSITPTNAMQMGVAFSGSFMINFTKVVAGTGTGTYTQGSFLISASVSNGSSGTSVTSAVGLQSGLVYLHIQRWSDGLWYAWYSYDGVSWVKAVSASNPTTSFFPGTIGFLWLSMQPYVNSGAQPATRQAVDWIRYNFLFLEP